MASKIVSLADVKRKKIEKQYIAYYGLMKTTEQLNNYKKRESAL